MKTRSWGTGARKWARLGVVLLSAWLLLCCGGGGGSNGDEDNGDPPQAGVLNGPCFEDGTCDGVLICENDICVGPADNDDGDDTTPTGGIGSSCGDCGPGLTCLTELAGGYCTRACSQSGDCGAGAYCYNTENAGALCFEACWADADCRQGYTCQGESGKTVCYPAPGGDPPQGNYTNAAFVGCYALNNELAYRLLFDGVNRFADIQWTPISGEIRYAGTYSVAGNQITFQYTTGERKQYAFVMMENGFDMDGYHYYRYDQGCE